MRSARGHFQSAHGGITGPRRDMPAELSDRTIRGERHVSYKQRVRPVPSAVFAMRDAENGLRKNKSSLPRPPLDRRTGLNEFRGSRFQAGRDARSVMAYGLGGVRVPDCVTQCMTPPKPTISRAKVEFLATPKTDLESEKERREENKRETLAAARAAQNRKWTVGKREELVVWREKRTASEQHNAHEKSALESERRRYQRELNAFVLNKARKEMDVFSVRRRQRFDRATSRAAMSSFGRHSMQSTYHYLAAASGAAKRGEDGFDGGYEDACDPL